MKISHRNAKLSVLVFNSVSESVTLHAATRRRDVSQERLAWSKRGGERKHCGRSDLGDLRLIDLPGLNLIGYGHHSGDRAVQRHANGIRQLPAGGRLFLEWVNVGEPLTATSSPALWPSSRRGPACAMPGQSLRGHNICRCGL